MREKILVTGAKGFIGSSMIKALQKENYEIIPCSRINLDLNDSQKVIAYIKELRPDVVIHCATYDAAPRFTKNKKELVFPRNTGMYNNLAQARKFFGKMIYFGSGAEFGRDLWGPQMKEEDVGLVSYDDPYGFSKYMMNLHANTTSNIYNLRLFSIFGEGDDWRYRTVSNLCCKKVLNKKLVIPVDQKRDFLYVKDLVNIVKTFISATPKQHDYNLCSGEVLKNSDVALKLDKDFSYGGEVLPEYSGDNRRLLEEFPHLKFTPFDEALENMVNYYERVKPFIEKDKLEY